MHTPASPKIMQSKVNSYKNIVSDIKKIFQTTLKRIDKYKIPHSKIWFDPGIGFGKNLAQNIEIMQNIQQFKIKFSVPFSQFGYINKTFSPYCC